MCLKDKINAFIVMVIIVLNMYLYIYFGFIIDYNKVKLEHIGYNENEIKKTSSLSEYETNKILKIPYKNYLDELITNDKYISTKLFSYINYIKKIDGEYKLNDIIYIINNDIKYSYSKKLSDIINSKYFLLKNINRYMSYEADNIPLIISSVNTSRDREFYKEVEETDTLKSSLMIVNKYHILNKDYTKEPLVPVDNNYSNFTGSTANSTAYEAFKQLMIASREEGIYIYNNSAYRSYDEQEAIYRRYVYNSGESYALDIAAKPGYSEHQTGLAFDVGVKKEYDKYPFDSTKEYSWLKDNLYKYGFILRYPLGKENITGYNYEPWHIRYVGKKAANIIYIDNITLEEYYAYYVEI
ncbi:MAG: M15 family metallopeptidase [Bacilli bacterium]